MSEVVPAFEVVTVEGKPRVTLRDGLDWNDVIAAMADQVIRERIAELEFGTTIVENLVETNSFTIANVAAELAAK